MGAPNHRFGDPFPSTAVGPYPSGFPSADAGLQRSRYVRRRRDLEFTGLPVEGVFGGAHR